MMEESTITKEKSNEKFQEIIEKAPIALKDIVIAILIAIFPKIEAILPPFQYLDYQRLYEGNKRFQDGFKNKLICGHHFDEYFHLYISESIRVKERFKKTLDYIDDLDLFREKLKAFVKQSKSLPNFFLDKIIDPLTENQKLNFLIGFLDLNEIDLIYDIKLFFEYTEKTIDENKRLDFTKNIANNTKNILYLLNLVELFKYFKNPSNGESEDTLKIDFDILDKFFLEKIKKDLEDKTSKPNPNQLLCLIYYYSQSPETEDKVRKYVAELINNDLFYLLKGLIKVERDDYINLVWLREFIELQKDEGTKARKELKNEENLKNFKPTKKEIISENKKLLADLTYIEQLDKKVRAIDKSKLNKEEFELIDLYFKY